MDVFVYIIFGFACFIAGYCLYKIFDLTAIQVDNLTDRVDNLENSYKQFLTEFMTLLEKHTEQRKKEQELAMKLSDLKEEDK